jgi:hypothetical protein
VIRIPPIDVSGLVLTLSNLYLANLVPIFISHTKGIAFALSIYSLLSCILLFVAADAIQLLNLNGKRWQVTYCNPDISPQKNGTRNVYIKVRILFGLYPLAFQVLSSDGDINLQFKFYV